MSVIITVCLLGITSVNTREVNEETQLRLLNKKLAKYNKKTAPAKTVDVAVSIYVDKMSSFNEVSMDYDMTMFFRQHWRDKRLSWGEELNFTRSAEYNSIHSAYLDKLWIPDLFFVDEKGAKRHNIVRPNVLLEIDSYGNIFFSERLTVKLGCDIDLEYFPFDTQICPIRVESYSMRSSQLKINWVNSSYEWPLKLANDIKLPSFTITGCFIEKSCKRDHSNGNYSCLSGFFGLSRHLNFYMVHLYIPSTLCVVVSWTTFWIELEIAPARVTLAITTFLAIIAETQYINQEMRRISYVKAIDVWMFVCIALVFLSITEYCVAHAYQRHVTEIRESFRASLQYPAGQVAQSKIHKASLKERIVHAIVTKLTKCDKKSTVLVDEISRLLFPSIFVIFVTIYMSICLCRTNEVERLMKSKIPIICQDI